MKMKLGILYLVLTCFWYQYLQAQGNGISVSNDKWNKQISITDVSGRPFENKYADVNGTPFYNPEYRYANIILQKGRSFNSIKTKINLESQQVNFVSANGVECYMEAGVVREVNYEDTSATGIQKIVFKSGFPPVDRQGQSHFYRVLVDGNCSLLKAIIKHVGERKNELSGEVAKDFEKTEEYYLYVNGQIKRVKKDKEFILNMLSNKKEQVSQFITDKKINIKNTEQLLALVNYYNTL